VYSDFYEIPLPALCFEKVEENSQKVNNTKENDAQPLQKYKTNIKEGQNTTLIDSKETQNQPQVNDTQGTQTLPEQRNADRKSTSISAFEETAPGTMTPARLKAKDLRKQKQNRIFL
jgi:hypothetical protein